MVLADGGMMPPLGWKESAADWTVVYTTERLHCYPAHRMKAAAVMHTLSSKCGADAFLSILRGLVHSAMSSRRDVAQGAAEGTPLPWVLSTSPLIKQIAQVRMHLSLSLLSVGVNVK